MQLHAVGRVQRGCIAVVRAVQVHYLRAMCRLGGTTATELWYPILGLRVEQLFPSDAMQAWSASRPLQSLHQPQHLELHAASRCTDMVTPRPTVLQKRPEWTGHTLQQAQHSQHLQNPTARSRDEPFMLGPAFALNSISCGRSLDPTPSSTNLVPGICFRHLPWPKRGTEPHGSCGKLDASCRTDARIQACLVRVYMLVGFIIRD